MYVCQVHLLIWSSYLDSLPEAICCLQTYTDVYCMCLPPFFFPSGDNCQIYAITILLPEAICCCLDTCNI